MTQRAIFNHNQSGFTLVEMIITMVIASIFAVFLATYLNTAGSHSVEPVNNIKKSLALHQTMELIITHYKAKWDKAYADGETVDLDMLKTSIGTGSQNNSYGTYTVLENKYIEFSSGGAEQNSANTNLLKVKISDSTTTTLSIIFSKK